MASTPVIINVIFSPNPAFAGEQFLISISAVDVQEVPSTADYRSGEFYSGEI